MRSRVLLTLAVLIVCWYFSPGLSHAQKPLPGDGEPPGVKPAARLSPAVLLSDPTHMVTYPRIVADSLGRVYVAWTGHPRDCVATNAYFTRSLDGGATFSSPRNLSGIPCEVFQEAALGAKLAVDASGALYVVWIQYDAVGQPPYQIFFTRSTDGGETFAAPQDISHSPAVQPFNFGATDPDVSAGDPGHVCAAWHDGRFPEQLPQIFATCSEDAGDTFAGPVQVSFRSTELADAGSPSVAVDGAGNVFLGWWQGVLQDHLPDAFFTRSIDGGASFSTPLNLSAAAGGSSAPSVRVDEAGAVYVVWGEESGDGWFRRSLDGGVTFSQAYRLGRRVAQGAGYPGLAVGSSGQLHAFWVDLTRKERLFLRVSENGGQKFRRPVDVSGQEVHRDADLVADPSGNLFLVFAGSLYKYYPNFWWNGVYFRRSLPLPD